jgi:hypothetical protein
MLSDLENRLKIDIESFFTDIESQTEEDKRKSLMVLLDKYIHITKSDYLMDGTDLINIISGAKTIFVQKSFPTYIGKSNKQISQEEQRIACIVESTILHLNHKECFKKLPKFDYKE